MKFEDVIEITQLQTLGTLFNTGDCEKTGEAVNVCRECFQSTTDLKSCLAQIGFNNYSAAQDIQMMTIEKEVY